MGAADFSCCGFGAVALVTLPCHLVMQKESLVTLSVWTVRRERFARLAPGPALARILRSLRLPLLCRP